MYRRAAVRFVWVAILLSLAGARGASPQSFPLPERPARLSSLQHEVDGQTFDVSAFMRHNRVAGLLVIHDGATALERYDEGSSRDGRTFDGRAILPEGWMRETTAPSPVNAGYGQLWWVRPAGAYAAIGIYGQAIYIDPSRSLVIVTHSAWPRATGREFSSHREALFSAVAAAFDAKR
jgi:CubicO group peptidase (beta-lactamase class C family)